MMAVTALAYAVLQQYYAEIVLIAGLPMLGHVIAAMRGAGVERKRRLLQRTIGGHGDQPGGDH